MNHANSRKDALHVSRGQWAVEEESGPAPGHLPAGRPAARLPAAPGNEDGHEERAAAAGSPGRGRKSQRAARKRFLPGSTRIRSFAPYSRGFDPSITVVDNAWSL